MSPQVLFAFMVGLHNLYWYYGSQTFKTEINGVTTLVHTSQAFQGYDVHKRCLPCIVVLRSTSGRFLPALLLLYYFNDVFCVSHFHDLGLGGVFSPGTPISSTTYNRVAMTYSKYGKSDNSQVFKSQD